MTLNRNLTHFFLLLSLGGVSTIYASPIFGTAAPLTGTRTESSGEIVTGGGYSTDSGDFTLDWTVTQNGGLFTYTYDLSGYTTPAISHLIISLSDGCSLDTACITDASSTITFDVFSGTGQGNSNPGFPAGTSISGVKFNSGSENSTTYTFTSDRAPVYGDFYLKGGSGPFAYNSGLTNSASSDQLAFVARPDTSGSIGTQAAVPEPGSLLLFGGGAVLLALGRLRYFAPKRLR